MKYRPTDDWVTELGESEDNIHLTFRVRRTLVQGQMIEARYRAKNSNGWSGWSNSGFLQMIGPPERPERPVYIASTANTIELRIIPVTDNNGGHITKYYLFRDGGDYSTDVNIPVADYLGVALTHVVSGLSSGKIYRFVVQAENAAGISLKSYETIIAAAELPPKPTFLEKDIALSNKTAIHVRWTKVPNTEIETTGYILSIAEQGSLDFKVIYYGFNKPQVLEYTATGLKTGMTYQFKLSSMNFNGKSL